MLWKSKDMKISDLVLPDFFKNHYSHFDSLSPIQQKAVQAGLLEGTSLLVCAPTASGKTLVGTMAIAKQLEQGKVIYLVPLKALGAEKYKEYRRWLDGTPYSVALSTGDNEYDGKILAQSNLLLLTTEKLDSLLRERLPWLTDVKAVIIDEIHLLNDPTRGPTLEIIITLLKMLIKPQIIGLSATIGNPQALAAWLEAELVQDTWRPVELQQGIHYNDKVEFYSKKGDSKKGGKQG